MTTASCIEKKILVVLTGGTICSEYKGKVKEQGDKAGTILEERFRNSYSVYSDKVYLKTTPNFEVFSENITVNEWNGILEKLRNMPEIRDTAIVHGNYPTLSGQTIISEDNVFDGIIIAHGTDTLAYSSALFSILLKNIGVPVFMVSSNEALSSDRANGCVNFIAAVECICEGIKPNVYVTYRNTCDNTMYLHLASRLVQCRNYEEDFYSVGMVDITNIDRRSFEKIPKAHDDYIYKDEFGNDYCIDLFDDFALQNVVLKIDPYVGLNYEFFNFKNIKAILHGTYHSGTVCTEKTEKKAVYSMNSVLSLIDQCGNIPIYISPSDLSGGVYDTVMVIVNHNKGNIHFLYGYTTEMIYVKLMVAFSIGEKLKDINAFLASEYNCEFICGVDSATEIIYPG